MNTNIHIQATVRVTPRKRIHTPPRIQIYWRSGETYELAHHLVRPPPLLFISLHHAFGAEPNGSGVRSVRSTVMDVKQEIPCRLQSAGCSGCPYVVAGMLSNCSTCLCFQTPICAFISGMHIMQGEVGGLQRSRKQSQGTGKNERAREREREIGSSSLPGSVFPPRNPWKSCFRPCPPSPSSSSSSFSSVERSKKNNRHHPRQRTP